MLKGNRKFITTAILLITITLSLAYYVADLLFYGKSSYEVYANLEQRKAKLQNDIQKLQDENALLQKKYFELKNLEPEEL
jgi:cell division protein FtsB